MKLRRGDVTTISIPKALKRRLDELKGEGTYTELLEDLLKIYSPEVVEELDLRRGPDEGYGDVILNLLKAGRRDPGELEGFLKQARLFRRTGKVRVVKKGGEVEVIVEPWK
jgi:hypothetical protein